MLIRTMLFEKLFFIPFLIFLFLFPINSNNEEKNSKFDLFIGGIADVSFSGIEYLDSYISLKIDTFGNLKNALSLRPGIIIGNSPLIFSLPLTLDFKFNSSFAERACFFIGAGSGFINENEIKPSLLFSSGFDFYFKKFKYNVGLITYCKNESTDTNLFLSGMVIF